MGGFDWNLQVFTSHVIVPVLSIISIILGIPIVTCIVAKSYPLQPSTNPPPQSSCSIIPMRRSSSIHWHNKLLLASQVQLAFNSQTILTKATIIQFNWHSLPEHERKRRTHTWEPAHSPTMAGGLFSIDRDVRRNHSHKSQIPKFLSVLWAARHLRLWLRHLGSREPRVELQDLDVWRHPRDCPLLPCWAHLQVSYNVKMLRTWWYWETNKREHIRGFHRKRSPYKWRSGSNVLRRNSIRLAEVKMITEIEQSRRLTRNHGFCGPKPA